MASMDNLPSSKISFNLFRSFRWHFWLVTTVFLLAQSFFATALTPTTPIPEDPVIGNGSGREDYPISGNEGTALFTYDMYDVSDSMQVEIDGKTVINTGFVKGKGFYPFTIPAGQTNQTLSVNVNAGEEEDGNDWQYAIHMIDFEEAISGLKGLALAVLDNVWDRLTSHHADPVDTATGAQVIQQNLFTLWGAQPLPFSISYNSLLTMNGPFGRGWSHNYQGKLEILDQENVRIRWNSGRYNTFTLGGKVGGKTKKKKKGKEAEAYQVDEEKEPSARFYQLQPNSDSSYTLTDRRSKSQWRFDSQGQLIALQNGSGQSLNLAYNASNQLAAIQEPISGRQLDFIYNEYGKVTQLTDPGTGRSVALAYDNSDLLTNIVLANTNVLTYTYNDVGQILSGRDSQGLLFLNTYDVEGRIIAQDDGRPETPLTHFTYLNKRLKKKALRKLFKSDDKESAIQTLITESQTENESVPTKIKGKRKHIEQTTVVQDRNQQIHLYQHNEKYQLLTYVDPENRVTRYRYNREGDLRSTLYPGNRRVRYNYDDNNHVIGLQPPGLNPLKMEYDAQNNLTSASGEKKQTHRFDYDDSNHLTRYTDPLGNGYQLAYTADGLLQQITKPGGGTSTYNYQQGRPTQIKDTADNIWNLTYDVAGRVATSMDPDGNSTTYTYDEKDRVTSITDPLVNVTTYQYDLRGNLSQITDAEGAITTLTYTPHRKLASITDAQTNVTAFTYDNEDRLLSATDALGNATRYEYDGIGRRIATLDPLGNRYTHRYDETGKLIETIDPLENSQYQLQYNRQNQPSQIKTAQGEQQRYRYDKQGRLTKQSQEEGRASQYDYDALHRLTQTKTSAKQITQQGFDSDGNLTQFTDPQEKTTTLEHDKAGQLTLLKTPSGQGTTYTYNKRNLLESVTLPAGQTFDLVYDAAGRLETLTEENGDTSLAYDKVGRPLTVTKDGKILTRQYDTLGRLTQFTDTEGNTLNYAYDAIGRLTELTYPDGKIVAYTYDAKSQLIAVTDWADRITHYTYDEIGRLTETQRPNGSKETRVYDKNENANQLIQLTDTASGQTLLDYSYRYNHNAQLTEQEGEPELPEYTLTQSIEMSYDADNRLITYNGLGLNYDPNSNLLNSPLGAYAYDNRNRLTNANDLVYTYDSENRRITIEDGESITRLVHNPNAFLSQLLVRKTPNGKETYYVYGLGLLYEETEDQVRYYHYDRQGNTLFLTDQSGQITDRYAYSPYGETLKNEGSTDTPFLYSGRYGVMTDSNGLLQMRARYYNPKLHRFLNQDILLGSISEPLSLNRFAYVNGDPINNIDPFGLAAMDTDGNSEWNQVGFLLGSLKTELSWEILSQMGEVVVALATTRGLAFQEMTPAALEALQKFKSGEPVYRIGSWSSVNPEKLMFGEQYWSVENPMSNPNYNSEIGRPSNVKADWIVSGRIMSSDTPAITRVAPGVGANSGGAMEVITPPGGVKLRSFIPLRYGVPLNEVIIPTRINVTEVLSPKIMIRFPFIP